MNQPLLFVLGPRRSGTNLCENLLIRNFDCTVADLNAGQNKNLHEKRKWLFETYGSKHDISPTSLERMTSARGKIVAVSRNPQDWFIGFKSYMERIRGSAFSFSESQEKAEDWVSKHYNGFWRIVLDFTKSTGVPIARIRYEDLVLNLQETLQGLHRTLELPGQPGDEATPFEAEALPGGNIGGIYRAPENPFSRYDHAQHQEELARVAPYFDQNILHTLGYTASKL